MENKQQKLATEKQWRLYVKLSAGSSDAMAEGQFLQLPRQVASKMLGDMLRASENGDHEPSDGQVRAQPEFSVQRLGMCFKQMHSLYGGQGKDVFGANRDAFKQDVQRLYELAGEIELAITSQQGGDAQ